MVVDISLLPNFLSLATVTNGTNTPGWWASLLQALHVGLVAKVRTLTLDPCDKGPDPNTFTLTLVTQGS